MEYRYKQLNFRVTDSEYEIIQKKMKLSGIKKPTAYLRKMAMDGYVIRLDLSELTEIKEEVVCTYTTFSSNVDHATIAVSYTHLTLPTNSLV